MEQELYRTDNEKIGYIQGMLSLKSSKRILYIRIDPSANVTSDFPPKNIKLWLEHIISWFSKDIIRHIRANRLTEEIILAMIDSKRTSDIWCIYIDPIIDIEYENYPYILVFDKYSKTDYPEFEEHFMK